MSLDAVVQSILKKGAAGKHELVEAAREEAERMLNEARMKGQEAISSRVNEAGAAAGRLKVQEMARADLESRKTVLAAQKEVLDGVKTEVLKRLSASEHRTAIVRSLLERNASDWRGGRVFCAAVDQKLVASTVGSRFGGTIECAGGIVIESDDGTRRIDLRFETLLEDIWEDSVKELAEILWPKR